jgi:hypothetical protein
VGLDLMHVGSDVGIDFAMDGLTMIGGGQNRFFFTDTSLRLLSSCFLKKGFKTCKWIKQMAETAIHQKNAIRGKGEHL